MKKVTSLFPRHIRMGVLLGFTLLLVSFSLSSQATFTFRNGFGGTSGSERCNATCVDVFGNMYVTGSYSTTAVDFGTGTLAAPAAFEGFVAKYNSSGVCQWSFRFGGAANDIGTGIATDGSNTYITGTFTTSMTIGGSPTSYPSAGGTDGFVMKVSAATGGLTWVTTFGGGNPENAQAICLDPSGNPYVSGNFSSNPCTFGSFPKTPTGGANSDLFAIRLNPSSGAITWAATGGVTGNDNPAGSGICYVPALGEVVVAGGTNNGGTATYGAVSFATSALNDIVLLEINAGTGAFVSGMASGGSGNEEALGACYDSFTGDVFLCGYFQTSSITFGANPSITNSSGGTDELFYARYNPSTDAFGWSRSAGGVGSGTERARAICSNGQGGIYVTGIYPVGSTVFPPGGVANTLTNARPSGGQIFLAKISALTGDAMFLKNGVTDATTTSDNSGNAVACNPNTGDVWLTGLYTSNTTFSPLASLASTSNSVDILIAKLIDPPLTATQSQVNLTCNGVCTGSATVVASGGIAPYTYSWSPAGGSGATASSLCATNYTVTITDAVATSITKTFNITQPPAIVITPNSQTNVSCSGGNNGAAQVSASGGTGTLTYNWTPGNPAGDGTGSVTGLTAQVYTVTLTDANSCTATRTFNITAPPALATTGALTNVACFGGSNGTATVTVTGGQPSYSYNWTPGNPPGDGTATVTGLTAQVYTVTVTDANACQITRTFNITQPVAPVSGSTVVTNVSCFGGNNGAINLIPTGGTGPYTFNWLPSGPTTEDRTGLIAGTYTVQVTDVNGCTGTVNATVTQPTSPVSGTTVVTNVACFGGNTGAINLTPTGGTGPYTFNWLPSGPTTEDRTGLIAGTYTVQVTDMNGCTGTINATVTQPTSPVSGTTVVTNVSCFGGNNGAINLTPTGGTGPYTFNWLPSGPTTEDRTGLVAGTYTVQITDLNGCTGTVNATVTQPTSTVSGTTVVTNVACFGGNTGAINLTPTGGTGPYTFNWLPSGPTTEDRTGLVQGTYTVQITDFNGCTGTVNATVTQPTSPVSGTTVVTNVACFGGNTGAINLTPTGGTGPYTFNWLPSGPTTEDRTGLVAGTYTVQITDFNGCTGTVNATVTQPTSPVSGTTVVTNVACFGGNTGAINLTPTGGTGPYTFNWLPSGPTTEDRTGLVQGTYTVQITDFNGCTGTVNATVTQPTSPVSGTTVVTNVACFGGNTGAINLTPTGGTGPYTFNWLPSGPTTEDRTGLVAGTYTVQITDFNGCTGTVNATVTQPTSPVSGTTVVTNVACFGGNTGAINLTPTGGTGPYTFNWLPSGPTTEDRTGLVAGTYTVQITDFNGCTGTVNATVTQPTSPVSGTTVVTNVACFGGNTGAINLTPTGGTGPYTFNWLPSGPTTEDRTGLVQGTYTVQITDFNGCTGTVNATVTQPTSPVSGTTVVTNVACFGGNTGAINLTPTGGTGPYTFNWLPSGPTTEDRTGLVAGTYTVQITDFNGCTGTVNATVTQPTSPVSGTTVVTNVACFGGNTGAINLTPTGGTGPYTFNWLPSGPTTEDRTGLVQGTYTVQITDFNGCTGTVNATVTQVTAISLTASSQTNIACNGGATGAASVNAATGGTPGYTYNWTPGNPTGDGTTSVTGLTAGTWTCTVTDANSCTTTQTFNVTAPTALTSSVVSQTNISCNGGSNGAATISAGGGTPSYTYNWTPGNPTGDGTVSVSGLTAGTWTCTITDANSCTKTQTVNITAPPALVITPVSQTNIACNGGSTGAASVSVSGGAPAYSYNWTPGNPTGDGTASVTGLTAGTWTCTVTDANSCTTTQTFNITAPPALSLSIVGTSVTCNGSCNGSASATPSGGTPSYTYSWNTVPVQTTATATGLCAGTYTCIVTDANSCTTTQIVTITQPSAVTATISSTSTACSSNTGTATVSASGGTPGYTYSWAPSGGTAATATGLGVGSYTCTITDANGCIFTVSVSVTTLSGPTVSLSTQTNVTCNGACNGSATIAATGGTAPYTYSWSPSGGTAATATALCAGSYIGIVTDANGCSGTINVTITQPAVLTASSSASAILCNGGSSTVIVTGSGGTAPYTGTGTFTVSAGTYNYMVTDAHGCTASTSITVTEPTGLIVSSSATTILCNGDTTDITVTASGGTFPYTGEGTFTEFAGTYSYTVTDAGGCTASTSITVTEPTALMVMYSATPVLCNGGTSTVVISAMDGTAPYTGEGTFTVSAGTHTYIVTDDNGCSVTEVVTITEPTLLTASASATTITCNGGTATVTVVGTGGTSPYTGTGTFTVSAGTHNYTVTDDNGCTTTTSITISQPTLLTASSSAPAILCNGDSTDITVVASGGTGIYSGTGTFTVAAGTYNYTVTDANGCTSITSITVSQPTVLTASSSAPAILCNGDSTEITVAASGGTGTYSGTGTFTVGPGTYNYTVTDVNGCTATTSITVTEPTLLTASSSATTILCNGGTAEITVVGAGGTSPYTGTGTFTVTAGTHNYTVTDDNGCIATTSITVTEPTAITSSTSTTPSDCTTPTGTATVTASGGTGTLIYAWSSGGTAATESALPSGTYTVTITDDNACTSTNTASVSDVGAPTVTSTSVNVTCNGGNDGSIDNAVTGGTGSFTYAWSNSGSTEDISSLVAGAYSYTVTDAAGCSATGSVMITEPSAIDVTTSLAGVTISANNTTATSYQWIDCATNIAISGETTASYTPLADGDYAVVITEGSCVDTSACVTVIGTGISASTQNTDVNIYPNPFSNSFTIKVAGTEKRSIIITNVLGETVYMNESNEATLIVDLSDYAKGMYTVTVKSTSGMINRKVIKE